MRVQARHVLSMSSTCVPWRRVVGCRFGGPRAKGSDRFVARSDRLSHATARCCRPCAGPSIAMRPIWIRWLSLDQLDAIEATTGVSSSVVEAMTPAARFVVCHNPDAAARDATVRERLIEHVQGLIDGSDAWPKRKRDEFVGSLKGKPGLRRLLRRTKTGLLRIDSAAAQRESHYDGKWLLRTSDLTLTAEDLAAAYKQLLAVERGWRDCKTSLGLRPVNHHREDRIRAHVQLCWLALLLIRVAEPAPATLGAICATNSTLEGVSSFMPSGLRYSSRTASDRQQWLSAVFAQLDSAGVTLISDIFFSPTVGSHLGPRPVTRSVSRPADVSLSVEITSSAWMSWRYVRSDFGFEDVEFSLRAWRFGSPIIAAPDSLVTRLPYHLAVRAEQQDVAVEHHPHCAAAPRRRRSTQHPRSSGRIQCFRTGDDRCAGVQTGVTAASGSMPTPYGICPRTGNASPRPLQSGVDPVRCTRSLNLEDVEIRTAHAGPSGDRRHDPCDCGRRRELRLPRRSQR